VPDPTDAQAEALGAATADSWQAAPDHGTHGRAGWKRLAAALLIGTLGWSIPFNASILVLLPSFVADLEPAHKISLFGLLSATAAVVGLVTNIVWGALSDLTRSRWGSRTPFIVGGGVATSLALLVVPRVSSFVGLLVAFSAAVLFINAINSSLNAIVPDRVPHARRASVSAVIGLGILLGTALGAVIGAPFVDNRVAGYLLFSAIAVVLPLIAVLLAPDLSNVGAARPVMSFGSVLRSMAPPRKVPDFYWALWGRLLLVLGYFMVQNYQLYLLTDYVGLGEDDAARVVAINSVIFLVAAIVGTLVAGPLSDRLHRRKPFIIAASGLAVLAAVAPFLSATVTGMTLFAVIGGMAFGSYYSVDTALMTEVLPSHEARAKDLGILNTANSGGQILAPVAATGVIALGLGFGPLFLTAMLACTLGAVFIVPIKSVR
jgi:MFS family permease